MLVEFMRVQQKVVENAYILGEERKQSEHSARHAEIEEEKEDDGTSF